MPALARINRRQFIGRSALGAAATRFTLGDSAAEETEAGALAANERITVGMIGVGARAHELMQGILALHKDPKVRAAELPATREAELIVGSEQYREVGLDPTILHFRSFFKSVRTREQPAEDAVACHRAASCAHLINRSAREKRLLSWDFGKESLRT